MSGLTTHPLKRISAANASAKGRLLNSAVSNARFGSEAIIDPSQSNVTFAPEADILGPPHWFNAWPFTAEPVTATVVDTARSRPILAAARCSQGRCRASRTDTAPSLARAAWSRLRADVNICCALGFARCYWLAWINMP